MFSNRDMIGKVTLENKQRIPYPVEVRVVCGDAVKRSTRTDSQGNFSIDPIDPNEPVTAATKTHPQEALLKLTGCTAEAVLAGFRSSKAVIGSHALLDSRDIGVIVLHPEAGQTDFVISPTSQAAPKDARKAFEKAREELDANKIDHAVKDLKKAVALYPGYAEAWRELGTIQERTSVEEARNSYKQAIVADPRFLLAYQGLTVLASREGKWEETIEYAERAIKVAPHGFPDAWYSLAMANYRLGHKDAAEKSAQLGLAEDSGHRLPELDQLLGVVLYDKGEYAGALEHLQTALKWLAKDAGPQLVKEEIAAVEKAAAQAKK
jgi:predicted negative regulator of RcsB-dependent stress response